MVSDLAYVTAEMWLRAQDALRAVLPHIHVPPLSTQGTMVSLRKQVQDAIVGDIPESLVNYHAPAALASKDVALRPCPFCCCRPESHSYVFGGKSYAWVRCEPCNIRKELNTNGEGHEQMVLDCVARWWNGPAVETPREPDGVILQRICDEIGPELFGMQSGETWLLAVRAAHRSAQKATAETSFCSMCADGIGREYGFHDIDGKQVECPAVKTSGEPA
jgi:hypothetical protein